MIDLLPEGVQRPPSRRTFRRLASALLLCGCAAPRAVLAQSEHDAVLAAVQGLFDAMARKDSTAMKALLTEDGVLYAVRADTVAPPRATTHRQFIAQISGASDRLLERMWEPQVTVDGPIALVWARYDFHVNEAFSHCGIDAVSLVRAPSGWKISGITYTFQRSGCAPSPLRAVPPRR